jgi:phytoene/squalene synthetase
MLREFGLCAQSLSAWEYPDRCARIVGSLCSLADAQYAASSGLEDLVNASCRSSLWAMTAIYQGVLGQLRAEPALSVRGRARLSALAKAVVMARAALGNPLALVNAR